MGNLFGFLSKDKNTKEKLEDIQNEIDQIEEYKLYSFVREKNIIALNIFLSVIIYLSGIVYIFLTFSGQEDWLRSSISLCFLLIFPFISYYTQILIRKYFKWTLDSNNVSLRSLLKLKKKIISKVQETETFNDAKAILEKYDPSSLRNMSLSLTNLSSIDEIGTPNDKHSSASVNFRRATPPMADKNSRQLNVITPRLPSFNTPTSANAYSLTSMPRKAPTRTVRPILPQNRSVVEKMVDYMFNDGPANRFALICSQCCSHNGMARPEDFEFISYICAYCAHFNPSSKTKPTAPTVEEFKAIELPKANTEEKSSVQFIDLDENKQEENKDEGLNNCSMKSQSPIIEEVDHDEINKTESTATEKSSTT